MITEFGWSQLLEAEIADLKRNHIPHLAVVWNGENGLAVRLHVLPVQYRPSGQELVGVVTTLHETNWPEQIKWLAPVVAVFTEKHGWIIDTDQTVTLTPRIVAAQAHVARQNADANALHGGIA